MKSYNPEKPIDAEEWLELDESLHIELIQRYHQTIETNELEEGAGTMHALIHVIIENQLAMDICVVKEALNKLVRQSLHRHDAIHAIGAVISDDIFAILSNGETHDMKKYRGRLARLTAKRWRKGKY